MSTANSHVSAERGPMRDTLGTSTAPTTNGGSRLLTADDLALGWQVPKAHVYRLTRECGLPAVRIGRYYRYRAAAIEEWECHGGAIANE